MALNILGQVVRNNVKKKNWENTHRGRELSKYNLWVIGRVKHDQELKSILSNLL